MGEHTNINMLCEFSVIERDVEKGYNCCCMRCGFITGWQPNPPERVYKPCFGPAGIGDKTKSFIATHIEPKLRALGIQLKKNCETCERRRRRLNRMEQRLRRSIARLLRQAKRAERKEHREG